MVNVSFGTNNVDESSILELTDVMVVSSSQCSRDRAVVTARLG
jgi:hypothetical protein